MCLSRYKNGMEEAEPTWKKLSQRDSFVYLGGVVCGDGGNETEIRRSTRAVASAWRKADGMMEEIKGKGA